MVVHVAKWRKLKRIDSFRCCDDSTKPKIAVLFIVGWVKFVDVPDPGDIQRRRLPSLVSALHFFKSRQPRFKVDIYCNVQILVISVECFVT